MYHRTPVNAREILSNAAQRKSMGENPTYVICGRGGPTGKTWLCNELKKAGHNAIEITYGLATLVNYQDNANHVVDCGYSQLDNSGCVLIVLNKPVDWKWQGKDVAARETRYRVRNRRSTPKAE